jgi:hypothetical protein
MIAETFCALLAGHLVADFLTQTSWTIRHKNRPSVFALHIGIVAFATFLAIGVVHWPILLFTAATHAALDALKTALKSDGATGFALDQVAHIAVCLLLALVFPLDLSKGLFLQFLPQDLHGYWFAGLALVSGVVAAVPGGGYLIAKMMVTHMPRDPASKTGAAPLGMAGADMLVGRLERLLILVAILAGQPGVIGFLLVAKSILRFPEINAAPRERHLTEYVIIGTLLSFSWGIFCGALTLGAIGHFLAPAPTMP